MAHDHTMSSDDNLTQRGTAFFKAVILVPQKLLWLGEISRTANVQMRHRKTYKDKLKITHNAGKHMKIKKWDTVR